MSYADKVFVSMCRDILDNGTSTEGEKVRPHWPDGTPAYTIKKFVILITTSNQIIDNYSCILVVDPAVYIIIFYSYQFLLE